MNYRLKFNLVYPNDSFDFLAISIQPQLSKEITQPYPIFYDEFSLYGKDKRYYPNRFLIQGSVIGDMAYVHPEQPTEVNIILVFIVPKDQNDFYLRFSGKKTLKITRE